MHQFIRLAFRLLLNVTVISVEVALVGSFISWLQLRYMKRRDKTLDERSGWAEVHKAMLEFRFRREILNNPKWQDGGTAVIKASEALHKLKGQLDRTPDSPLVIQLAKLLDDNSKAEQWRSVAFEEQFDTYTKQVAIKAR